MSAPTTHDPLVVNTKDGVTWLRRAVTSEGRGLYAVTDSCKCPPYLMATLAELAEHGIAGSADVLPMPAGPGLSELEHLRKSRDAFRDQRNAVFTTNQRLIGEVQESDQARLRAENETRTVRREAGALRARVAELEQQLADAPLPVTLTAKAAVSVDKLTALLAPTQALREDGAGC